MPHQLVVPSTDQTGDYDHSYGVIIADAIKIEQTANPPGTSQADIHYIHSDHLNTPQRITNTAQQTVWAADYQPFGQATLTTASITNPLRFPGQYYDEETNLHYNYFRDYDPTTGRYIQSDPIGLAGGLNTYGYVVGNPLMYSDLLGLLKRCARGLGDMNQPAMSPSGNPVRHDYLVVGDDVYSFQAGDNMLLSDGFIDNNEKTDNELCEVVDDDSKFDEAALQAISEIGAPKYNVYAYPLTTPHMFGARNCQTWADDVIDRATEIYNQKK